MTHATDIKDISATEAKKLSTAAVMELITVRPTRPPTAAKLSTAAVLSKILE